MDFKEKEGKEQNFFYTYQDDPDKNIDGFFQRINDSDLHLQRAPVEVCEIDDKKEEDAYWIESVK